MVDQSAVGREFTPVTARAEPGRLRFFLDTLGEGNPVYRDESAAPLVPPTYLFCLEMMDAADPFEFLTALNIDLARVLHGEQRFDYFAPVAVGDTVTFRPRVTSVAEKKGGAMTLIVVETRVTNQDGVHVADLSRTIVVRNPRPL
jgi:MaoC dehydratase-like protein